MSWTLLDAEVWEGSWNHELLREGVQGGLPQVRGVQGGPFRSEAPVAMIVNSSELCRFTEWVPGCMYSPWIMTMSSGHDVSEYELGVSGLLPMFHHNNREKMIENREKS